MLSRQALATRSLPLRSLSKSTTRTLATTSRLQVRTDINVLDPLLNGGYPNPPAVKRQFRDPYGKYWDQQERRNYGEPIHEDNDVLGIFTTEKYTWTTPGWGAVLFATFIGSVLGLATVVGMTYPDKPSVAREFDLVEELGGKEALIVSDLSELYYS
jgi:NADH dehydrogenase (ubiquinone) 1 beta subcomplex subunit 8